MRSLLKEEDERHEKAIARLNGYDVDAWMKYKREGAQRPKSPFSYQRCKPLKTEDDTGFGDISRLWAPVYYITWGKPAQITQAKLDRECFFCGAKTSQGFGLGYENGKCFGGYCSRCGWGFSTKAYETNKYSKTIKFNMKGK